MRGISTRAYLLAGATVLVGAFWLFVHLSEREPEVIKNEAYCADCGKELPGKGQKCPWCLAKKTREEIEAKARGETPTPKTIPTPKIVAGVIITIAVLVLAFWRNMQRLFERKEQDEEYLDFRCKHCSRKLRYLVSRAGMLGKCPRCKKILMFPAVEPEPEPKPTE